MTWVRFDDQFPIHRKVAPLDDATYRLASEAVFWCARNKTDGRIGADELEAISKRGTRPRAAKLVERGLWHEAGTACASPKCPPSGRDGWVLHDYLDYQPTKIQVEAELAAKAERTRKWREAKARGQKRDGRGDASRDASQDSHVPDTYGVSDASPSPPRPEGKRGGDLPDATAVRRGAAERAADGRTPPPTQDPYPPEDPAAIAADQQRIRQQAAQTARANANGAARTAAGAAAARAAIAENRARSRPPEERP